MRRYPVGLVLAYVLAAVGPLHAQQPVRFTEWRPAAAVTRDSGPRGSQLPDSLRRRGDHRQAGAVIGAVAIGTLGVLVTSHACPAYPGANCKSLTWGDGVVGGGIGVITGGLLGYIVGRWFPKGSRLANAP